jgi:GNAT superfamily N-acetyltransferase
MSEARLTLRRATDGDAEAVRGIAWRSWAAAYGPFVPEADRRRFFDDFYRADGHRRAVRSERSLFLVAEDAGAAVAFALASDDRGQVHLHRLYADPERWRRGAGQALWDALLGWARARGATRIEFEVASDGASGPRFYLKQGCRPVRESVMPVGRTPVRVTIYEYPLA